MAQVALVGETGDRGPPEPMASAFTGAMPAAGPKGGRTLRRRRSGRPRLLPAIAAVARQRRRSRQWWEAQHPSETVPPRRPA
ncbi:MAG: hypothetical protein M5U27_15955 [Gaiella sp.]|nr:hypothetical protein [Gaiella sp.]